MRVLSETGEKVVYGTELHKVLNVKSRYTDWVRNRLFNCDAIEDEDFEAAQICAPSGQTKIDHIIKLDTAKEMAMPHIIVKEGYIYGQLHKLGGRKKVIKK